MHPILEKRATRTLDFVSMPLALRSVALQLIPDKLSSVMMGSSSPLLLHLTNYFLTRNLEQ